MSIKSWLSSDGLEEMYNPPTLKELCLYKCLTNKDILVKDVEVDENEKLDWEKFRLKEPIQMDLLEALLDVGEKYLYMLTPKYVPIFAAIRTSQPEHLVKLNVSNTTNLEDCQLEWLLSGGHVRSLDIHACPNLSRGSLAAINKFGNHLEYLRIEDPLDMFPRSVGFESKAPILVTPRLKTFIVSGIDCYSSNSAMYWRCLMQDFIANLRELRISNSRYFDSLEFLEPARSKLTSLTLANCEVRTDVTAWYSLFKMDMLKYLDLLGTSIGEAFVGEDVVQRLLSSLPKLSSLAVDPGLLKNTIVESSTLSQGTVPRRLKFLGVVEDDADELRKAKLFAKDVFHFGSVEGELRILEFHSTRLSSAYRDTSLMKLFEKMSDEPSVPESVTAIKLLMRIIKHNGLNAVRPGLFCEILKSLLTRDVVAKLGNVIVDQITETIVSIVESWTFVKSEDEPFITSQMSDVLMSMGSNLLFHHYAAIVSMLMQAVAKTLTCEFFNVLDEADVNALMDRSASFLEMALKKFSKKPNELWGISSLLVILKVFTGLEEGVTQLCNREEFMEPFSSMIASMRKMCSNSVPRRAAIFTGGGVQMILKLLTEIINESVTMTARDCFNLLQTLESIVRDKELTAAEPGMITSGLENLLIFTHRLPPSRDHQSVEYIVPRTIVGLLNYLESDPLIDYQASPGVKEIMMKLN